MINRIILMCVLFNLYYDKLCIYMLGNWLLTDKFNVPGRGKINQKKNEGTESASEIEA